MKTVASKSFNPKILPKSFTKKEIAEILHRKADGDAVSKNENRKLRDEYRRIKRIAKEMEANNNQQIILVPSLVGESFYEDAICS